MKQDTPQATTIALPWPVAALAGHNNGTWRGASRQTRQARNDAYLLALQAKVGRSPDAILEFEYFPPDSRKRDAQNMPQMLKPYIDGIADAMGCDDNGFKCRYPDSFSKVVRGGEIIARVRPDDGTVFIPIRGVVLPDRQVLRHSST